MAGALFPGEQAGMKKKGREFPILSVHSLLGWILLRGPTCPFAPDVSSAGTLTACLGRHRNSRIKQIRAQTSMPLVLGFAESSYASAPIALRDRQAPSAVDIKGGKGRARKGGGHRTWSFNDLFAAWHADDNAPTALALSETASCSTSRQRPIALAREGLPRSRRRRWGILSHHGLKAFALGGSPPRDEFQDF